MIPQSFIQDLLARVDIVEVIERYLPLKKGGANYFACCPFHGEKSASFSVSPTKQFYHCFGCGVHGSAISFLMEYNGLGFIDAVKELASTVGMEVPEDDFTPNRDRAREQSLTEIMAQAARFYKEQLKRSPVAIDYLKGRGLTGEVAARYGLGYAPEGWQALQAAFADYNAAQLLECGLVLENEQNRRYDRFRDRIMFPIQDQRGNVIGFGGRVLGKGEPKYLNSPETPIFEKGRELYGLVQARQAVREQECVLVVEGYMDVVGLAQFGVGNAVATLGTAATPHHIQKLLRLTDRVVFCFDGDAAGRRAAGRALEVSLEHLADNKTLSFLFLPEEHDPDSFVRAEGPDAFRAAMTRAQPLADFLLAELRKDIDLGTAEGCARLIHEAKPPVTRIAAPLLRLQVIKMLAEAAGFTQAEVEQAFGLKPASTARRFDPPASEGDFTGSDGRFRGRRNFGRDLPRLTPRQAPSNPVETLLKLVIQHPVWTARLPIDLLPHDTPEGLALIAMTDAMSVGELPTHGVGALLEHYRDTPHAPVLARISGQLADAPLDEAMLEPQFNDTLYKLESVLVEKEITALNTRARESGLEPTARRRLAELLSLKEKLKTRAKASDS
ncbi:DNA primase [Zoogloea sp.]|jgi:DNA primase|uniref:DNA primase n=2 Tax=Zoogloea sp. TaxID=49181 RepID=UPI0011D70C17|nr:DNA primase [Zoogloea sp.]MBK6654688.1 DNA primase [Zoogloea sp.]MBP7446053.1 DNA primase [Zoogloea sp.]TXG88029.1 MAG: DNA primase [Zoogloea sp.]